MKTIPTEKQLLPVNPVEVIEHAVAQGIAVSGDELLQAIECSVGHQLDDRLRAVIRMFSASAVKRRGRPSLGKGQEDFALEDVDVLYAAALQKYEEEARQRRLSAAEQGAILAVAEPTPSELAYTEILALEGMKEALGNIGWAALRNKHSAWKNGRFHSADNHIGSDDYDAEIERLFPVPPDS